MRETDPTAARELRSRLDEVLQRAAEGRLGSKVLVMNYAVIPVLRCLGWDADHPDEVFRDDGSTLSLFTRPGSTLARHGDTQPALTIRVVAHGDMLEDRPSAGVPVTVGTDGTRYLLRHSQADESPPVHVSADDTDAAERLWRFLGKPDVHSGESQRNLGREQRLLQSMETSWHQMLSGPDPELMDLLRERSALGQELPSRETVRKFLSKQDDVLRRSATHKTVVSLPKKRSRGKESPKPPTRYIGFEILGERHAPEASAHSMNGVELIMRMLEVLQRLDGTVLEKMRMHPKWKNRMHKPVGLSLEEIHPERQVPHIRVGGYYIHTSWSHGDKMDILRTAAEIAGLQWGTDVRVFMDAEPDAE